MHYFSHLYIEGKVYSNNPKAGIRLTSKAAYGATIATSVVWVTAYLSAPQA